MDYQWAHLAGNHRIDVPLYWTQDRQWALDDNVTVGQYLYVLKSRPCPMDDPGGWNAENATRSGEDMLFEVCGQHQRPVNVVPREPR